MSARMAFRHYIVGGLLAALLSLGLVSFGVGSEGGGLLAFLPAAGPESTQPASRWQFIVNGNREMTTAELLKAAQRELEAFESQDHAASAIDDAAFQMELTYRHAGYPQALVEYEILAAVEGGRVVFTVEEGVKVLVHEIVFQGNQALNSSRLLALDPAINSAQARHQPFPYVAETMAALAQEIRKLYASEGYLDVEVQPIAPPLDGSGIERLVVTIAIDEGTRYTVGPITVEGDVPEGLAQKIADITKGLQGTVYQRRQKLVLKSRLRDCFENAGYADAAISVEAESEAANERVLLTAIIDSGRKVAVDEIRITGNTRTSSEFIRSRLSLKPGEQYRLDDKQSSFQDLYQTGLFSNVDIKLLAGGTDVDRRTVEVQVEERKAREFYLEPGWGSYELLRLRSGYKDRNIFGSGRILRVDTAVSAMGRSLELGVSDPWLLGSDITMDLPLHYRYRTEPVFTMENTGMDVYLTKAFHKNVTLNMGYQYSKNVVSDVDQEVDPLHLPTNYNTASISCQLTHDTRNDVFFPSSGYRGYLSLEAARPDLGGSIAYNRMVTGVRYFHPLPGGSILGLRFNTGFVLPTGEQQSIPVGERFFNGGESSVRSFKPSQLGPVDANGDPLGGAAYSTWAVEWRKKFTEDWAGSLFFDLGNVSPNRTTVDGQSPLTTDRDTLIAATFSDYFTDLRSGVGTGLQYMLPVGPARLDLAFNPDRDQGRDEADYVVHFSIGMAF